MKKLGIIGGMGPAATVCLFDRIVGMTQASCDQEHLDITILSDPSIPDRTEFLTHEGAPSFVPPLQEKARLLAASGCEVLAMPCNTSHARFEDIAQVAPAATFIHMPQETMRFAEGLSCQRPLVLATDGTIQSGVFQKACLGLPLDSLAPKKKLQALVMEIIYEYVKKGRAVPPFLVERLLEQCRQSAADCIVLGCTELSTLPIPPMSNGQPVIDSLNVLAWQCVLACEASAENLRAQYTPESDNI